MILTLFFTILSFLNIALADIDEFIDYEQTRNIKHIYKQGVFDSELPVEFRAENGNSFKLPYYKIPVESNFFREIAIDEIPDIVKKHHLLTDSSGKTYFLYVIHPSATEYYESFFDNEIDFVSAKNSKFHALPTASERTVVIKIDNKKNGAYQLKLNLPLKVNHRDRTLYPTEIRRGIYLSHVVEKILERRKDLSKHLSLFKESFGFYPKYNDSVSGGIVFREFPNNFFEKEKDGKVTIPFFSFLAENPDTGKPLFFEYIPESELQNPWVWFEREIYKPLENIIGVLTFEEGVSLEIHSQNLLIELDTVNKRTTQKFSYRDMGSAHLDLHSLLLQRKKVPHLNFIDDIQRELGLAYLEKSELHWLNFFLRKQIFDLTFIQMASHGLISREQREQWKIKAWKKIKHFHDTNYKGYIQHQKGPRVVVEKLSDEWVTYKYKDQKTQDKQNLIFGDFALGTDNQKIINISYKKKKRRGNTTCKKLLKRISSSAANSISN